MSVCSASPWSGAWGIIRLDFVGNFSVEMGFVLATDFISEYNGSVVLGLV